MSDLNATLNEVATHLESAAHLLRELASRPHQEATPEASPIDAIVRRAHRLHPSLGVRQEEILRRVAEAGASGTTTGAISRQIRYEQPNVYLTLTALSRHGLVRKDAEASPHRYYLGPELS